MTSSPGPAPIAVIPARGGSKRIPRKNIKPFHGIPLIQRTIHTLLESGLFVEVVVSTDDDDIAQSAQDAGASVPFRRPAELADDHTTTAPVIIDALDRLTESGLTFGDVAVVYPAAIFMTVDDLKRAHEVLDVSGVDIVFSACAYGAPIQRAWRRNQDGTAEMISPENYNTRTQDLEVTYYDAGQFYWWAPHTSALLSQSQPVTRALHLMPPWRVQDIDTPEDWHMAERLFSLNKHL